MALSGSKQVEWADVLSDAFTLDDLQELLLRLDDDLTNHANPLGKPRTIWREVISAYSRRDIEDRLILEAGRRTTNVAVGRLAAESRAVSEASAERLIRESNAFLDVQGWLAAAAGAQRSVCRVEVKTVAGDIAYGTGFLVGPDLVLTNHHVVEPILSEPADGLQRLVSCRFDYALLPSGAFSSGLEVPLAKDGMLVLSPNAKPGTPPTANTLDAAVMRLAWPEGTQLPGTNGPRRWIDLPRRGERYEFPMGSALFILQHPEALPLKLSLETNAIRALDPDRLRVRYSTNTQPGSSGSPCFNQNWKLVALHHAGGPSTPDTYNEGIPIDVIVDFMIANGVPVPDIP